jgi:hypothetical protein
MYGRMGSMPKSNDGISFFVGSYLAQVSFGKFDLGLNFDRPASNIMIESSFGVRRSSGDLTKYEIFEVTELRDFLNCDVSAASWGEQGTLILEFQDGNQILVFDDSDQYESFVIRYGTITIVI